MSRTTEQGDRNNFIGFPPVNEEGSMSDISILGDNYHDSSDTIPIVGRNDESRFVHRTELLVREAEQDVTLAKHLIDDPEKGIVDCMMMSTRLEQWIHRLDKGTAKFEGYQGENDDVYVWLKHKDNIRHIMVLLVTGCREKARLMEASKFPAFNASKMIKTTPSAFPKFDGASDFDIWVSNWEKLANGCKLSQECLLIKLRESLVGRAAEYIGKTGLASLSYDEVWDKLKLRYAVPWLKTQQASRRIMEIQPPAESESSVIKYVDVIREAVDISDRAGINIENLFFNICVDNLPERIRVPLVKGLEPIHKDFKFKKETFENEFSRVMALLKHNSSEGTSSMFSSNTMSRGNYGFNSNGSNSNGSNNVSSNGSNNNNFYASSVAPLCIMCKPDRHRWTECKFNTPQKRRDRLVTVGRCKAFLLPVDTHGVNPLFHV